MAKKQKLVKISFELTEKEYDALFNKHFEETMDNFCDEYGDDDGEEDWLEPKDRTREYFEDMTKSEIVKDFLWTRI